MTVLLDSVEQGDKIVQTALDNFGRIGMLKCSIYFNAVICSLLFRHSNQQRWVSNAF